VRYACLLGRGALAATPSAAEVRAAPVSQSGADGTIRGDELKLVCPVCAQQLLGESYAAVASDVETTAVEQGSLSLAG